MAQFFPRNPLLAFLAGFVSHFLLDAIPHWDYKPRSRYFCSYRSSVENEKNRAPILSKTFGFDMARIGLDFCLGTVIALVIFIRIDTSAIWPTLAGILGGIMPDPLVFLFWKIKKGAEDPLQRLHAWAHCQSASLDNRPFLGLALQILLIFTIVLIVRCLT